MDSSWDPSYVGVTVGLTALGVIIVVIAIGVGVTCYYQKHKSRAIIVANLRAKRIHVLQTMRSIPPSTRASMRSIHREVTVEEAAAQDNQEASVRIIRAASRSAGARHSTKSTADILIRRIKSADAKKRHLSGPKPLPLEAFVVQPSSKQVNDTPILLPIESAFASPPTNIEQLVDEPSTSQATISYQSFEPKRKMSFASPRDLQETSIMIDPQANMQTMIILDDTSSVATSLPYVN